MDTAIPPLRDCFPSQPEHPLLFFRAAELGDLRQTWREGGAGEEYAGIKEQVLRAIRGDGVPPSPRRDLSRYDGDFEGWIGADQAAKCLVGNAALVALVEDDAALAQRAYDLAQAFMAWPSWVHPQLPWMGVDLRASANIMAMAILYDFLFPWLTPNQRLEIESICWARGLAQLTEDPERESWATNHHSNWCAVCSTGVGVAALTFAATGQQDRDAYLRLADSCARNVWRYLDEYGEGGGWREGATYWGYGTGLALTFAHVLRSATDGAVDLFRHPRLADIGEFPLRLLLPPDRQVNFGDCYSHPWLTPAHLKLAQEQRDGRHLWYFQNLRQHYHTNQLDIFRVLWWPAGLEPTPIRFKRPSAHFPEIGWVVFRADGLIVPVKIGTTVEPHGHADVGNFLLHWRGETLIREFGMPRYGPTATPFQETGGHNLPLFDGHGQQRDRARPGNIETVELGGPTECLTADLTEAYGYPPLRRFRRSFVFTPPDVLTVEDHFEVEAAVDLQSRLHYTGEAVIEGDTVLLRAGAASATLEIDADADFRLSLGRCDGLIPNQLESREPITVPHLEIAMDLRPPSAKLRYTFRVTTPEPPAP